MRRAYLVYRRDSGEQSDCAADITIWSYSATVLLDSVALTYEAAGMTDVLHHYDAFLQMQEKGDAALEETLAWDDEVWTTVDIGPITPHDDFRHVVLCVLALHAPARISASHWPDALEKEHL